MEYISKIKNEIDNNIKWKIFKKKNKNLAERISKNAKFKDIHLGERCFVIGNGPSLTKQDLSLLKNEVVFTVNQITRNPQFNELKTNYHFWADPIFFNLSPEKPEDMELLNTFKSVKTDKNNPVCFMPVYSKQFIDSFELEKELTIEYYCNSLDFHDSYSKDLNFTKFIPNFQTVVQYAIAMAIYMGFSEIYLIGCDTTGIMGTINSYINQPVNNYSYNITENEKKRMKNMYSSISMENTFLGWARILHIYKTLDRYCDDKNIRLVNCSADSIIDSISRESYEDVLSRNLDSQIEQ